MSHASHEGLPLYDALIVGAGPSGGTLARQLSRGGWRTALVDREPLGRDRVCGGFLGPEAGRLWRELDLERRLASLPSAPIRRLTLSGTSGARIDVPLPDGGGMGVARADVDRWLCDRAGEAGTSLWMSTRVKHLRRTARLTRIALECHGQRHDVYTRLIIRATGRRRVIGAAATHPEPFFGCKTVYEQVADFEGCVALHFVRFGHVGFNRLRSGRTTMCLYVGQSRLRAVQGRLDEMMARLAEENPAIGRLLRGARRAGPWMGCQAQSDGREVFVQHGGLNIGDAVTMLNPVLGGGLSVAMGSAVLLARELLAVRPEALDVERVAHGYAQAWREQFAGRARLGRWLSWCEQRPAVSESLLRALSLHPAMFGRLVRYARPAIRLRALAMAG